MIATGKCTGITAAGINQLCSLVRAAIVQHVHLTLLISGHYHRYFVRDIGGVIIAAVRHLTIMTDKNPSFAPDAFHLQLKDFLFGVNISVNFYRFYQFANIFITVGHAQVLLSLSLE
jgi:hypothetical protein